MDGSLKEQLMELMLKIGAFKFGSFTLSSGKKSSYYVDARLVSNHALGGPLVGQLILDLFEEQGLAPDSIGGLEAGAISVSCHVQAAAHYQGNAPIQGFYVRKKPKGHGLKKSIEGNLREGDNVVIAEDVITTGGSAGKAIEAAEAAGAKVLAVVAIIDREEGGRENLEEQGHKVFSLLKSSDFQDVKQ